MIHQHHSIKIRCVTCITLAPLLLYATPTPHWMFLTIAISPAQLVPWLLVYWMNHQKMKMDHCHYEQSQHLQQDSITCRYISIHSVYIYPSVNLHNFQDVSTQDLHNKTCICACLKLQTSQYNIISVYDWS